VIATRLVLISAFLAALARCWVTSALLAAGIEISMQVAKVELGFHTAAVSRESPKRTALNAGRKARRRTSQPAVARESA
jgi:hypothetical protein